MNIYALDRDPAKLVEYLTDRHLASTIGIAAELLCCAHIAIDGATVARERVPTLTLPVRVQPLTDPWGLFAAAGVANYDWIAQILWQGCDEFAIRGQRLHSFAIDRDSVLCLRRQLLNPPLHIGMQHEHGEFPICLPFLFIEEDAVQSYRKFYSHKYRQRPKEWSQKRMAPSWITGEEISK